MNYNILAFPWKHGYSENFLDQDIAIQMEKDFPDWDAKVWDLSLIHI